MKKRVLYFDILNILACLCVIFLHCNGQTYNYTNSLGWYQALAVEVICYWAVPIFLMLSGANLMNYRKKYSTKEYFKKRFIKTVIPFLIWTVLVAAEKRINPFDIGFGEFLNKCINCTIENVYWFFIPLFAVYLSIPIISLLKDNRKVLLYMVGGAFLLNCTLPYLLSYIKINYNTSLSMVTVGGYLIFPILGYLLSTADIKKTYRIIIYIGGILSALLRYAGTLLLSVRDGALNKTFFGYTQYHAVILGVAVFVLFKYSKICEKISKSEKFSKIIANISACSFGIYLIHMTVYRFLARFIPTACWQWRLLVPFLIYSVALLITFVIKKIPVVKHIMP